MHVGFPLKERVAHERAFGCILITQEVMTGYEMRVFKCFSTSFLIQVRLKIRLKYYFSDWKFIIFSYHSSVTLSLSFWTFISTKKFA